MTRARQALAEGSAPAGAFRALARKRICDQPLQAFKRAPAAGEVPLPIDDDIGGCAENIVAGRDGPRLSLTGAKLDPRGRLSGEDGFRLVAVDVESEADDLQPFVSVLPVELVE